MGSVTDLGYGFKPVNVATFDERLRVIRVVRRERLDQRIVSRGGVQLGTVFMVGNDPVAFYDRGGQHYIRMS